MRVDLSGVETFEVIDSGRYQAIVTDGEIRTSGPQAKHTGSEYINWEFTISAGENEGRKQWTNTPFDHGECDCDDWKDGALFGLNNLLAATEKWSKEELDSDEFDFEIDDVIGSAVTISVIKEKYEGDDTNNVKKVTRPRTDEDDSESLLPG
jgi:hypothetical protein